MRRGLEGGQGRRHHQRPDLERLPQDLRGAEEGRRSGRGRHARGRSGRRSRSGRRACAGDDARRRRDADDHAWRRPSRRRPRRPPAAAATGAGQFAAEAEAKAHCPSDTVVWLNTKSHKYHFAGHKSYGTTKQGAYMCEADAKAAGNAAAKGEAAEVIRR